MEIAEKGQLLREKGRWLEYLVLVCFFLSGIAGLIYEIVWTRMIVKVIGAAPFAVSIILTIFMAGLGVGAYLSGKMIDRHRTDPIRLVRIYGGLELVIGVYALIIPALLAGARGVYSILYNQFYLSNYMVYNFLSFIGCAVILCVPVICMGATLPVLCQFYVTRLSHLGAHAGRLYGLNTIGAAVGALVCGFWLIALLGMWGTLVFAVVINGFVGSLCLAVSFTAQARQTTAVWETARAEETSSEDAGEKGRSAEHRRIAAAALVIFAVSGFCAMAYEVIWTKLLGLLVGPTTYSFTIVLVTFILGLALGSMFFGWLADRTGRAMRLLLFTQVGAALLVLAISQLLGNGQLFFAKLIFQFRGHFGLLSITKMVVLFVLMILPTLCLGATFPLVGKIYTSSVRKVGKSIGFAYLANTIGAVLGSFCAGFIFTPLMGKQDALRLVIGLQLLTAMVVAGIAWGRGKQNLLRTAGLAAPALLGLLLCIRFPHWDPGLYSIGRYHRFEEIQDDIRSAGFLRVLFRGSRILSDVQRGEMVFCRDGISGFTTVLRDPNPMGGYRYALTISGKPDASSHGDMQTQALSAHFPMLFHPNAKKIMVVGLASGITAGEVLCYPIERLDVLDINPDVVGASDFFTPWNSDVLASPKTNLIIQDGRAHLQLTNYKYDVIISEPSNPWMSGLAALFTRDFFVLARDRLNENGVYVQFMHSYQMNWSNFSLVGRTFAEVFANSVLVRTNPGGLGADYLLVGFKGAEGLSLEAAKRNISYAQRSRIVSLADARPLYKLVVSEDLPRLFGPGPINTDDHPRLEFDAPKLMYQADSAIERNLISGAWLRDDTREIIEQVTSDVDAQIEFAAYALSVSAPFEDMVELSKATAEQKERYFGVVEAYCTRDTVDFALLKNNELAQRCREIQIRHIEDNIELMSDKSASYACLANLYMGQGRLDDAVENYLKCLRLKPDAATHVNLGVVLNKQGKFDEAVKQFEEALRSRPGLHEAHTNLGNAFASQNRLDEAVVHYTKALQIRPDLTAARRGLGDVLTRKGMLAGAVAEYQKVLELSPLDAAAHNGLGIALARQRKPDEAVRHLSKALQIDPNLYPAVQNIRRIVSQQAGPQEAIRLIEQACEITDRKNPFLLAELAASYAGTSRFSEAVTAGEKALELAESSGRKELAQEIELHLQEYKQAERTAESAPKSRL